MSRHSASIFRLDPYRYLYAPLLLLFVVSTFLVMYTIRNLRIREAVFRLHHNENAYSISADTLVQKYKDLRNSSNTVFDSKTLLKESRLMAVLSEVRKIDETDGFYKVMEKPAALVLNLASKLSITEPFHLEHSHEREKLLQAAYIYERRRDFIAAAAVYSQVLSNYQLGVPEATFIHLHLGFCYSLSGKDEVALANLRDVQRLMPQSSMATAALAIESIVLEKLEIERKLEKLPTSATKAKKLFDITAYNEAANTYSLLPQKTMDQENLYFKARAQEEAGQVDAAIRDYRSVIEKNPKNKWGLAANRRLYILSSFYVRNEDIRSNSIKRGIEYGDASTIARAEVIKKGSLIEKEDDALQTNREELAQISDVPVKSLAPEKKTTEIEKEKEEKEETTAIKVEKKTETKVSDRLLEKLKKQRFKPIVNIEKKAAPAPRPPQRVYTENRIRKLEIKFLKTHEDVYIIVLNNGNLMYGADLSVKTKSMKVLTIYGKREILFTELESIEQAKSKKILEKMEKEKTDYEAGKASPEKQ